MSRLNVCFALLLCVGASWIQNTDATLGLIITKIHECKCNMFCRNMQRFPFKMMLCQRYCPHLFTTPMPTITTTREMSSPTQTIPTAIPTAAPSSTTLPPSATPTRNSVTSTSSTAAMPTSTSTSASASTSASGSTMGSAAGSTTGSTTAATTAAPTVSTTLPSPSPA